MVRIARLRVKSLATRPVLGTKLVATYTLWIMDVDFLWQPWQDGTNLDDFFAEVTGRSGPNRLRIAVAWGKRSGIRRVRPYFDTWRANGGAIQLVLGLSEGGATRQGLEEALDSADSVHLFHDISGRTFHPKVYLAETADSTNLLVGSNNLTAGGVYFNYEAAISVRVLADDLGASAVMTQTHAWFDRLLADQECCRELTSANLPVLLSNPAYRIGDEDQGRRATGGEADAPEETDTVTPSADEAPILFFDKSLSAKKKNRHDPVVMVSARTLTTPAAPATNPAQGTPATSSSTSPTPTSLATPVMRWSKRLAGTDAQQPPGASTSPTYNLRLAKAQHAIDITTYFRHDFFDADLWNPDPAIPNLEYTTVDMEVSVYGVVRGTYPFRVDHNLGRVADQGNVPTVLKWGPLSDYMTHNNHVGDWVLLEKLDDDTFRMAIVPTDPRTV
jgi:hypothetical protein